MRLATSPGVVVQRTGQATGSLATSSGGEGQFITIRGLGEEFSIVTLNGRILATDNVGRQFAFDVLPSEMISGADVYKAVQASNLEGSIGGAVDLRSSRPFDYSGKGLQLFGSADGAVLGSVGQLGPPLHGRRQRHVQRRPLRCALLRVLVRAARAHGQSA